MSTPHLILEQDAELMAQQSRAWDEINDLAEAIVTKSLREEWSDVLALAEERDLRVESFLLQGICRDLFPRVMADVEEMTAQHVSILIRIKERQLVCQQQEDFLLSARQQIKQFSPGE